MPSNFAPPENPDFATLSGIVDRSCQVPFEIFQAELNLWMREGIAAISRSQITGEKNTNCEFLEQMLALGDRIFEAANEIAEKG